MGREEKWGARKGNLEVTKKADPVKGPADSRDDRRGRRSGANESLNRAVQTADPSGGLVLVDHTLGSGAMDDTDRFTKCGLSTRIVLGGDRFTDFFNLVTHAASVRTIPYASFLALRNALDSVFVVSHVDSDG